MKIYLLLIILLTVNSFTKEVFNTDFGEITITIDEDSITGNYQFGRFQLNGVSKNEYSGYWVKDISEKKCKFPKKNKNGTYSYYWGRLNLAPHNNLSEFKGLWSHCYKTPKYKWDGKRRSTHEVSCEPISLMEGLETWNTTWGPLKIYEIDNPRLWIGHYHDTGNNSHHNKTIAMQRAQNGSWEGKWVRACKRSQKLCSTKWTAPDQRSSYCWGGIYGQKTKREFNGFVTECDSTKASRVWKATQR